MSLGVRLNILITLLFATIFIGAGAFIISNARIAVNEEIEASARHTMQLIEVLLESVDPSTGSALQELVVENLSKLDATRHLRITVKRLAEKNEKIRAESRIEIRSPAPSWFISLVQTNPLEFHRVISVPGKPDVEILVYADPSDEITEAWYETQSILFFVLLFIILANVLLYFTLGRYLAPIESILTGLERIEQGDYNLRLPQYELPELSRISERFNHMADVLLESREENRRLTQKTLAIQEYERRYLAQELHDELGQSLSAIKAVAVSIEQKSVNSDSAIAANAKAIGTFAERMYEVARNMMQRLRPSVLDELGLFIAIQSLVDDWNERHGELFCHFECDDGLTDLGEDINISLYRIIQESLTNIVKHANANEVFINISCKQGQLELNIRDDGVGFDMSIRKRGLGLLGMQERVEALNGSFAITGEIDRGVRINIMIPTGRKEMPSEV